MVALEALEKAERINPDLAYLRSERARLLQHVEKLLLVDPADQVVPLLASHRPAPDALRTELAEAVAAVGPRPLGCSLEAAAEAFLVDHPASETPAPDDAPAEARRVELAAVDARAADLGGELELAMSEVDRTAEAVQMAQRSVAAFEEELTVRAGEDLQRMKRFAAAEQLRSQIEAVAASLRRAEGTAREAVATAAQAVRDAETDFDRVAADVADLARRARKLAEELPIDRRPEGEPLGTLVLLAGRLREHSDVLQPEIDRAEVAAAGAASHLDEALAAARLAGAGQDGPLPEDLVEALDQLLSREPGGHLLVLDEPFVGVDQTVRADLLEQVRRGASERQVVLLTEDPDVLGWAIELPGEEAHRPSPPTPCWPASSA